MVTRLPLLTVYGDSRVISEGPQVAIYPGPALPNVLVQKISSISVDSLVNARLSHGVGRGIDLGQPLVADAPSTKFTVLTKDGPKLTEVYALGIGDDGSGLTAEQKSARRALRETGRMTSPTCPERSALMRLASSDRTSRLRSPRSPGSGPTRITSTPRPT